MLAILWSLIQPFAGYLAAAVAAIGGFLALQAKARRDGRKQERQKQREDAAKAHIETRKEIDHAIDGSRATGGSWRDRLRQHRDKR